MDDLLSWLRVQLDADERIAQGAKALRWDHPDDAPWRRAQIMVDRKLPDRTAPMIATFADPDRALAEVDAKRRILEAEQDRVMDKGPLPERMRDMIETDVIRLLAQPYAGRDGWREEWADVR